MRPSASTFSDESFPDPEADAQDRFIPDAPLGM